MSPKFSISQGCYPFHILVDLQNLPLICSDRIYPRQIYCSDPKLCTWGSSCLSPCLVNKIFISYVEIILRSSRRTNFHVVVFLSHCWGVFGLLPGSFDFPYKGYHYCHVWFLHTFMHWNVLDGTGIHEIWTSLLSLISACSGNCNKDILLRFLRSVTWSCQIIISVSYVISNYKKPVMKTEVG